MISTELQHVQAHLNEVLNNWQQWNSSYAAMESYLNEAFERFEGDEAHIQLFLQDLDQWKHHYSMLQSTSTFLMDACDENIASNLQQKMAVIHCNWSYLLQYAEKYGSDTLNRASFDEELKQLDSWLTRAQASLNHIRKFNHVAIHEAFNEITQINSEVAEMETLFKSLSRRFQALVSEMAMPEIEDTMKVLKNQKELLVNVRSILPVRQAYLDEMVKKVVLIESQLSNFENEALNLQFYCKDESKLVHQLKEMNEVKDSLQEFADKGFDISDIEAEINHLRRQILEAQKFQKSSKRDDILLDKFDQWCLDLEGLMQNSSSNLLQMMVLLLNIMILSRQLKKENIDKVQEEIQETLAYIQQAEKDNKGTLSEPDTKLYTDLKILARSNLEQILMSITHDDKDRILAILAILLTLTKECSDDIVFTFATLTNLRDKIMNIPIAEQNESSNEEDEDEFEEEQVDPVLEATKAQLAKDTSSVSTFWTKRDKIIL